MPNGTATLAPSASSATRQDNAGGSGGVGIFLFLAAAAAGGAYLLISRKKGSACTLSGYTNAVIQDRDTQAYYVTDPNGNLYGPVTTAQAQAAITAGAQLYDASDVDIQACNPSPNPSPSPSPSAGTVVLPLTAVGSPPGTVASGTPVISWPSPATAWYDPSAGTLTVACDYAANGSPTGFEIAAWLNPSAPSPSGSQEVITGTAVGAQFSGSGTFSYTWSNISPGKTYYLAWTISNGSTQSGAQWMSVQVPSQVVSV